MNLQKKNKNPLAILLVLASLFLGAYFAHQFTLKNTPAFTLQAGGSKANSTSKELAPLPKESLAVESVKTKSPNRHRLSVREKYEAFLKAHPFNNREAEEEELGETEGET
jgi:hypothetical protein